MAADRPETPGAITSNNVMTPPPGAFQSAENRSTGTTEAAVRLEQDRADQSCGRTEAEEALRRSATSHPIGLVGLRSAMSNPTGTIDTYGKSQNRADRPAPARERASAMSPARSTDGKGHEQPQREHRQRPGDDRVRKRRPRRGSRPPRLARSSARRPSREPAPDRSAGRGPDCRARDHGRGSRRVRPSGRHVGESRTLLRRSPCRSRRRRPAPRS